PRTGRPRPAAARAESPLRSLLCSLRLSFLDFPRVGLLGGVGVVGAGVDLELGQLLAGEAVARQHPLHRLADDLLRPALEHLAQGAGLDPARVAAVAPIGLLRQLVAGDVDLLRVDDDDEVAGVYVGRVLGLALAPQRVSDPG